MVMQIKMIFNKIFRIKTKEESILKPKVEGAPKAWLNKKQLTKIQDQNFLKFKIRISKQ